MPSIEMIVGVPASKVLVIVSTNPRPRSTPPMFWLWNDLWREASSELDGMYSMPQSLHVLLVWPPRSSFIWTSFCFLA